MRFICGTLLKYKNNGFSLYHYSHSIHIKSETEKNIVNKNYLSDTELCKQSILPSVSGAGIFIIG